MNTIEIKDMNISFNVDMGKIYVIRDLNMTLESGCSVSFVGESGSGKSVIASAITRTLEKNANVSGDVFFQGKSVYGMSEKEIREIRGKEMGLIPQNASQAWDPIMKVGKQMSNFLIKVGKNKEEIPDILFKSLEKCGFDDPHFVLDTYPHRLSGGMSQRAMIAMIISAQPTMLIADEPTKGIDGKSIKKVIEIITDLGKNNTQMVITHDLNIAKCCKETIVLYGGIIIERGNSVDILNDPIHEYTVGLKRAHPKNGMHPIPGGSSSRDFGMGCPFKDRCSMATKECNEPVELKNIGKRMVRCINV